MVRCGLNGCLSAANPTDLSASSTLACRDLSALISPSKPIHRTRARFVLGNTPGAPKVRLKGVCREAACLIASATCGTCETSMSPRNFSVRCTPSGRTRRRLSIRFWRNVSIAAAMCALVSSSSSIATKVRIVSLSRVLKSYLPSVFGAGRAMPGTSLQAYRGNMRHLPGWDWAPETPGNDRWRAAAIPVR